MPTYLTPEQIDPARNLLWMEGRRDVGWEPGSFTTKLIEAFQRADSSNTGRLLSAFPEYRGPMMILNRWGTDGLITALGLEK